MITVRKILGLAMFASLFLLPLQTLGQTNEESMQTSENNELYVRGEISRFYSDEMRLSIRPANGKLIRVDIVPDTILEGVSRVDELEPEQQVEVWYIPEDDINKAVRIKKMMRLGC